MSATVPELLQYVLNLSDHHSVQNIAVLSGQIKIQTAFTTMIFIVYFILKKLNVINKSKCGHWPTCSHLSVSKAFIYFMYTYQRTSVQISQYIHNVLVVAHFTK